MNLKVLIVIAVFLIVLTLCGTASADPWCGGVPLTTEREGVVSGDLWFDHDGPMVSGEWTKDYTLPTYSDVDWAHLHVAVYCGNMKNNYEVRANITFNGVQLGGTPDGLSSEVLNVSYSFPGQGGTGPAWVNDHCVRVTSDYTMWYDVTGLVVPNSDVWVKTWKKEDYTGTFDGRIKAVTLVVAYNDGDSDTVYYWYNQGHDTDNYYWDNYGPNYIGETNFTAGLPPWATIQNVNLTAVHMASSDGAYTFNGVSIPTNPDSTTTPPGENGQSSYTGYNTWYVPGLFNSLGNNTLTYDRTGGFYKITQTFLSAECTEGDWYWKDYNGEEEGGYMPDFDQNQDFDGAPGIEQNYCAPTAEANSLWWFAQKYPDREVVTPGTTPQELIQELALLMNTNGQGPGKPHVGTYVDDEQAGIGEYLIQHGLTDLLYEHTELRPEFEWIEAEIERCQDVKLDLGFYEVIDVVEIEPGRWQIQWQRIGGHAVTAAGVDSENFMIAISDPDADNAGFGLPGVVRGPNHNHGGVPFQDPAYDHTQHNDGVSASHDIYNVTPSISPGGTWALTDPYWKDPAVAYQYYENNGGTWFNFTETYIEIPPEIGEIFTEIEAAVVISPCTPAIEVNKTVWNGTAWVKQINANMNDTVRFRLWIHNNGTCCNLTNLTVTDLMSDSLGYADNATVNGVLQEPVRTGLDEYVWNFSGPLAPCQNITIEFDALVIKCGSDTNVVNATGWCNETMVSDEDSADVNAPCLGEWYWKDYNGEEEGGYMPDFDQNQDFDGVSGIEQDYCAPTAEANSLWWFAQKYPDREVVPPGMTPQELIQELAWLMDTNGQRTGNLHAGTYVNDEQAGIEEYLIQHGLTDLLYEHTEPKPEFKWIEHEIERCQDVKLDLGFYEVLDVVEIEPGHWQIMWRRIGGHAVTAAGVNSENFLIAISDPNADNTEFGLPGVVRGPNHAHGGVPFRNTTYDHTQHNDGVSASHDIYNVAPSISPGGTWELVDPYWKDPAVAYWYYENNGGLWENITDYYGEFPPEVGEIHTEIEYAVVVSPKCTPGIEVNKTVWNGTAWVKEIDANVSDTVRFRLWVHNNGTCCNLTNITVMDTLPDSLNYSNNATVNGVSQEPLEINPDEYVWNFSGPLAPCENITIEFNASIVKCGNDTNVVNATGWCDGTMVSDNDSADVHAPCGLCGDVNDDGDVDMTDVMTLWYDIADYPYVDAYIISNAWAADVNCDSEIDMTDVMTLWYDIADYPYVDAYVVNCC